MLAIDIVAVELYGLGQALPIAVIAPLAGAFIGAHLYAWATSVRTVRVLR
jgi:hypothetical protein